MAMKVVLVLMGIALLAAGPATVLTPQTAATAFGIPADSANARAYLLATATRDVALGVWLLALIALKARRRILAGSMFALGIVAAGDAANVWTNRGGWGEPALIVHLGSLALLLGLGWWLSRGHGE